jgi:hypothetical protein
VSKNPDLESLLKRSTELFFEPLDLIYKLNALHGEIEWLLKLIQKADNHVRSLSVIGRNPDDLSSS